MENTPTGVLLILHQGFTAINEQDCINALPEKWKGLSRKTIVISYSQALSLADGQEINFTQFAYEHKQQFKREILPFIEKHKDYVITYFGLVPVPLGIDFGHLFFNYNRIEIFQWHHKYKIWYQETDQGKTVGDNAILPFKLPDPNQKGISSVLIRLSLAHTVTSLTTDEVLPNAAEIDIAFKMPDEDAIDTREKMVEVGEIVQRVFDQLAENRSDLDVIHLFAAIPCGPAFLIGTKISPNVHPFIQTYQYKNTGSPKYRKAILVKQKAENTKIITAEDREKAVKIRKLADSVLREEIRKFCQKNKQDASGRKWPNDVIHIEEPGIMNEPFWSGLPPICQTDLEKDSCSRNPETIENGAKRIRNQWHIDDYFLTGVAKRLKDEKELKRAFRLFFFHEVLHDVEHDLGDGRSQGVDFFPKVLEIADYQADVYALLNECGYQRFVYEGIKELKNFSLKVIGVNMETAWSELEDQEQLDQIQIRQLNRFLIWYWQAIRIENSNGTTEDILKILEEKPYIELAGLRSFEKNGRFYFQLDERSGKYMEMAIFYKNTVVRKGGASNFQIENLVKGIQMKDGKRILEELNRFYPKK